MQQMVVFDGRTIYGNGNVQVRVNPGNGATVYSCPRSSIIAAFPFTRQYGA